MLKERGTAIPRSMIVMTGIIASMEMVIVRIRDQRYSSEIASSLYASSLMDIVRLLVGCGSSLIQEAWFAGGTN